MNTPQICPYCKTEPHQTECEHLVIHGDDLQTEEVIASYTPKGAWARLTSVCPDLPAEAAAFFQRFEERFPSLVRVAQRAWLGEALGLGEAHVYVWVKDAAAFQTELGEFLKPQ